MPILELKERLAYLRGMAALDSESVLMEETLHLSFPHQCVLGASDVCWAPQNSGHPGQPSRTSNEPNQD